MPSPDAILRNLERLLRNIRAGTVPSAAEFPDLAADWATLLPDLTDADLDAAVVAFLRGPNPFWPTPGQVLEQVPARKREALVDDAEAQWGRILAAASDSGRPPASYDPDPRVDAAVREGLDAVGGLVEVGRTPAERLGFKARDFARAYRNARKVAEHDHEANKVLQLTDRSGPSPRRGGDPQALGDVLGGLLPRRP